MKLKVRLFVLFSLLFCFYLHETNAQIRIINDGSAGLGTNQPHNSAKFHIVVDRVNNPQGFLMPIMLLTERNSISAPADGLMVYVEDSDAAIRGPYYFSSSANGPGSWIKMDGSVINWTDIVGVPGDIADGDNQILEDAIIDPATNELTLEIENGNIITINLSPLFDNYWSVNGNNNPTNNKLGTTNTSNPTGLEFVTNNKTRMIIDADGRTIFKFMDTDNVFLGENSGSIGLNGGRNIYIQTNNDTNYNNGQDNIGIGTNSGGSIVGGDGNVAIGLEAGGNITNGFYNIHLGYFSGQGSVGDKNENIFIGANSGVNSDSQNNIFLGSSSGRSSINDYSVAIGAFSGDDSNGESNIFLGTESGTQSTNGHNIAIGAKAGKGSGVSDGNKLHIHSSDIEVGNESLIYGDFTSNSEFIDINGKLKIRDVYPLSNLISNDKILVQEDNSDEIKYTSVDDITAYTWKTDGNSSSNGNKLGTLDDEPLKIYTNDNLRLTIDTDGRLIPRFDGEDHSIAIGFDAGVANQNSATKDNTFVGYKSGEGNDGQRNTIMGYTSGWLSAGSDNSYYGHNAGEYNLGPNNTMIGSNAGGASGEYTSTGNTFVGTSSGSGTKGDYNTFIGRKSGRHTEEGEYNVAVGFDAGGLSLFSNSSSLYNHSSFFGAKAIPGDIDLTHATGIGAKAVVNQDYKIKFYTGADSVSTFGTIEGDVPYSVTSDIRFKKYIVEDVPGLDMIMRLRPVSYKFDYRDYLTHVTQYLPDSVRNVRLEGVANATMSSRNQTGFLAQEVEQVCNGLNYEFGGLYTDNPENITSNYSLAYSIFVVPLVKAVQEQQTIITTQESSINDLLSIIQDLEQRIVMLEQKVNR